jgi:hypothetical protein
MVEWQLDVDKLPERPLTHIQENYSCFYQLGDDGGNELSFRLHPNGLCLVGLAPYHAALQAAAAVCGSARSPAADPSAAAEPAAVMNVKGGDGEQQAGVVACDAGQQGAAPAAASSVQQQVDGGDVRVQMAQKLLQAEFRKGRGPLLQPETVLGRQAFDHCWFP